MILMDGIAQKGNDLGNAIVLELVWRFTLLPDSASAQPQALQEVARCTMTAYRAILLQHLVMKDDTSTACAKGASAPPSVTPTFDSDTVSLPVFGSVSNAISLGGAAVSTKSSDDTDSW